MGALVKHTSGPNKQTNKQTTTYMKTHCRLPQSLHMQMGQAYSENQQRLFQSKL